MASALVLTGETEPQAVSRIRDDERPDYVLDRIDRLMPLEQWEQLGWRAEDDGLPGWARSGLFGRSARAELIVDLVHLLDLLGRATALESDASQ